jgi:hypothetical protein
MKGWANTARGRWVVAVNGGFWALVLGVVLLIEDHALPGLLLVAFGAGMLLVTGYWVLPWGEPYWHRRTVRAWRDWAVGVRAAQATARRNAADLQKRVEKLPVPSRLAAERDVLQALYRPDLSQPEPSELETRVAESAAWLERASQHVARIEGEAMDEEERTYAEALRRALDGRLGSGARMYADSAEACRRFSVLLSSRKAPQRRALLQAEIKAAVDDYEQTMETARAAFVSRDFAALANIGPELRRVGGEMERCREELRAASPPTRPSAQRG